MPSLPIASSNSKTTPPSARPSAGGLALATVIAAHEPGFKTTMPGGMGTSSGLTRSQ